MCYVLRALRRVTARFYRLAARVLDGTAKPIPASLLINTLHITLYPISD